MTRGVRIRLCIHGTVGVVWLGLSIYCLTRPGRTLAESLPFIAFDSNFAIVYSAAAAIEGVLAGIKAESSGPSDG